MSSFFLCTNCRLPIKSESDYIILTGKAFYNTRFCSDRCGDEYEKKINNKGKVTVRYYKHRLSNVLTKT